MHKHGVRHASCSVVFRLIMHHTTCAQSVFLNFSSCVARKTLIANCTTAMSYGPLKKKFHAISNFRSTREFEIADVECI